MNFINDKALTESVVEKGTPNIPHEDSITCKPKLYERSEPFVSPVDGKEYVIVRWFDEEGKEHGARICSDWILCGIVTLSMMVMSTTARTALKSITLSKS